MNLRVDLILESEQRSGSVIGVKSAMRIGLLVAPITVLVLVAVGFINVMRLNINARNIEKRWEIASEKQDEALKLESEFSANKSILKELQGWKGSHLDWHKQLLEIQRLAPNKTQFTVMRITQTLQLIKNNVVTRNFNMSITGKAITEKAGLNVNNFKNSLELSDFFEPTIESVIVSEFSEDTDEGANKFDRIFKIDCIYKPREFQEPKK